jgi:hypothetical protein
MKRNVTVCVFWLTAFLFTPCRTQTLVEPPYLHTFGIRKATPALLFTFLGSTTEFDDPQGIATAKMKSRDDPKTHEDDDEVVVYGVNAGKNQIIYNATMWTLALYGSTGAGEGNFNAPAGIACDADGNVYVADCGNNRVVHLFNPKKEVRWAGAFTGRNQADPGLRGPCRVALDNVGRVFVSDSGNGRVAVFTSAGVPCRMYPARGDTFGFERGPVALAVADGLEPFSYFKGEQAFFCADRQGTRLWKIGFDGGVRKRVDLPPGHHAAYAAVDYYHSLWLTDTGRHCVLKYDHDLNPLDVFGSFGEGKNQFVEPRGIAIWKHYGQTFIAEKHGAQYFWVGTDCTAKSLRENGDNNYTLSLALTEYSFVSLFLPGRDTVWLARKAFARPGLRRIPVTDARDALAGGNRAVLRIEPTYSSYTFFKQDCPVAAGK